MSTAGSPNEPQETSIVDTLQSLIVAFVLAMTFRGFVTEGFVIPTGSMAPTLMGAHLLMHSDQTGMTWPVGMDSPPPPQQGDPRLVDPNLGPMYRGSGPQKFSPAQRMGDRILVLKCLYPFFEPRRFDVVVFKNPTKPVGDSANYIKRLIGLPSEQVWIADGDVFAAPLTDADMGVNNGEFSRDSARPASLDRFKICRKPEHVQRAVWQMVHHSDYVPINPDQLKEQLQGMRYDGPPWVEATSAGGTSMHWNIKGRRSYTCDTAEPTALEWNATSREITDWTTYNMWGMTMLPPPPMTLFPVSDVRISAGIVAQQPGLQTTLELQVRGQSIEFIVCEGMATIRMGKIGGGEVREEWSAVVRLPAPGKVFNLEFWHVDQSLAIYLDGERVVHHEYEWEPVKRLQQATGLGTENDVNELLNHAPQPPRIRWRFEGSPVTLHRVRTDRDLYYRHDSLANKRQENDPHIYGQAFGTHPTENPAILGPDQFMMCGDNSQMSLDSRLWGNAHPMIKLQVDDHPFTVNRKLLLGKAWVVYFPAPFALNDKGEYPYVPDFGRLRFIR